MQYFIRGRVSNSKARPKRTIYFFFTRDPLGWTRDMLYYFTISFVTATYVLCRQMDRSPHKHKQSLINVQFKDLKLQLKAQNITNLSLEFWISISYSGTSNSNSVLATGCIRCRYLVALFSAKAYVFIKFNLK